MSGEQSSGPADGRPPGEDRAPGGGAPAGRAPRPVRSRRPEPPATPPEVPAPAGKRAGGEPSPPPEDTATVPTPFTQQLGRVTIVVLAVLFGIFAVANSQRVDFSWVFGQTTVRPDPAGDGQLGGIPLIVLLVVAFGAGAALAVLTELYVARSRRARRRKEGR